MNIFSFENMGEFYWSIFCIYTQATVGLKHIDDTHLYIYIYIRVYICIYVFIYTYIYI